MVNIPPLLFVSLDRQPICYAWEASIVYRKHSSRLFVYLTMVEMMNHEEGITEYPRMMGLDRFSYPLYRKKVVVLYLHAYTTGEYKQYVDAKEAREVLDQTMRYGFGQMAFFGQQLVGAVLAMPLERHEDFPARTVPDLNPKATLYIAEVMVHAEFRGTGLGTKLVEEMLARPASFSSAVIRVWDKNRPAVNLYRKMGFRPITAIIQTKRCSPDEVFEMRKVYMHRTLESD